MYKATSTLSYNLTVYAVSIYRTVAMAPVLIARKFYMYINKYSVWTLIYNRRDSTQLGQHLKKSAALNFLTTFSTV